MKNLNLVFAAILFAFFTLTSCQKESMNELEKSTVELTTQQGTEHEMYAEQLYEATTVNRDRSATTAHARSSSNKQQEIQELLSAINKLRAEGCQCKNIDGTTRYYPSAPPLTINEHLGQAAQAHSEDNARTGGYGHEGSDGSSKWDRIQRTGLSVEDCIEQNFMVEVVTTATDAVKSWKESQFGHCGAIMWTNRKHIGIGLDYYKSPYGWTAPRWTALLANIEDECATDVAPPPPPPPSPTAPSNDKCSNPSSISCSQTVTGSTAQATIDNGPLGAGYGVWYTFKGNGKVINLSSKASDFSTRISVFYNSTCDKMNLLTYGWNGESGEFYAQVGFTFHVLLEGNNNARGNYQLNMKCQNSFTPSSPDLTEGTYRILADINDKFLHENGSGDKLVSTRWEANDDHTRFIFKSTGEANTYTIQVKHTGAYLHANGGGDKLVSTRWQPGDDYTKFIAEKMSDGTYVFKVKASGRYLSLYGGGDQLLSTRYDYVANNPYFKFRMEAQ